MTNLKNVDYFIFLYSADWCSEFMQCQLNASMSEYRNIKKIAREEVNKIIATVPSGDADYFKSDLSDERTLGSWHSFLRNLNKAQITLHIVDKIEALISSDLNKNSDEDDVSSFFWIVLCDSFDESLKFDCIPPAMVGQIKQAISDAESSSIDFEVLESASRSDWDSYLVSIKPGLPTHLSDFLELYFEVVTNFESFWLGFMSKQSEDAVRELALWLSNQYEELVGEKCILPNWMIKS